MDPGVFCLSRGAIPGKEIGGTTVVALKFWATEFPLLRSVMGTLPLPRDVKGHAENVARMRIRYSIMDFIQGGGEGIVTVFLGGWEKNQENSGNIIQLVINFLSGFHPGKYSPKFKIHLHAYSLEGKENTFVKGYHQAVFQLQTYEEFLG